jgi:O-methyltransferase
MLDPHPAAVLYLDLLKGCLTRLLFPDSCVSLQLVPTGAFDPEARRNGQDWPSEAETMIGWKRLESLQYCVEEVLHSAIPGDLLEAGVWRGGASILMRAVLKAYGDSQRSVWLADSFAGLPAADPERYPADAGDNLASFNAYLGVSLDHVRANFARYGLLDERVRFLPGWFRETLPSAPVDRIAVLRLDGDMYESTMDILESLYHRVSPGGFVVVDDYGALANCRAAVDDFRHRSNICEPLQPIDWTGVLWRREP